MIGFLFATHCITDQRTRNAATRCVLRAYNAAKCDCGPDPAGGAYSAPPGSLAGFKGAAGRGRGKVRKGKEERGKEREERGREGGEGEGRLTLMQVEQGCRLAKAGPSLTTHKKPVPPALVIVRPKNQLISGLQC